MCAVLCMCAHVCVCAHISTVLAYAYMSMFFTRESEISKVHEYQYERFNIVLLNL